MKWTRIIGIWFIIIAAETVHGILRTLYITPIIGDHAARQIGVVIGSLLIFIIAWVGSRWMSAHTFKDQLSAGAIWVILTITFEFFLGMFLGFPLSRMLADYDITQGGLMGFGIAFMLFAPVLASRLKRQKS